MHTHNAGFHCDAADKSGSAQLVFYCFQNTMLLQQPLEPCALPLCFTFYISTQPPHSLCIWIIIKMSYKSSERSQLLPRNSPRILRAAAHRQLLNKWNKFNTTTRIQCRSEISHTEQFFFFQASFWECMNETVQGKLMITANSILYFFSRILGTNQHARYKK